MKPYLVIVALIGLLLIASVVRAAPQPSFVPSLIPLADSLYYLGSSTPAHAWAGAHFDSITLSGVTRTTWPSGGGGGSSSFGSDNEIPFTNATSDDFDYAAGFTFDGVKLTVGYASTTALSVGSDFITDLDGAGLTITAGVLDFDGGASPAGDLGGTWANPSVDDDSHAHTGATLSGIDISSDTNLSGDTEIVLTGDALSIASTIARDTELHAAVTLAGEDYLSLSTQQITANAIDPDNLSASDFGSFSCNGTTCAIDNNAVSNAMLANSTISGIALGSNLADLTAANSTLTFSGTYNGSTARTIGLNLANANTWSAKQTFGDAEATNATSTGSLAIPAAASPNLGGQGRIAFDTTSAGNVVLATTTSAHIVIASATTTLYAFDLASTSPRLKSGGVQPFPTHFNAQVATAAICKVTSGTSVVVNLSDGTNDTNTITCTTTETQFAITSNNSFTARERIEMEVGTVTGSVDSLSIRWLGYRTSD